MTKLLDQALQAVRRLPAESQDEIARAMLHLAGGEPDAETIGPAHLDAVIVGLAQARRGEFATEAAVEAVLRRFDR